MSTGDNAKFGLNTAEILFACEKLKAAKLQSCLRLVHFHIGSQVPNIITIKAAVHDATRPAVLISVGVHGDETGPIEVVAYLLDALSHQPSALAVDLMLCVGSDVLQMSVMSEVEPLPETTKVAMIGLRDWEMGKNFPAEIALPDDAFDLHTVRCDHADRATGGGVYRAAGNVIVA